MENYSAGLKPIAHENVHLEQRMRVKPTIVSFSHITLRWIANFISDFQADERSHSHIRNIRH